MLVGHEIRTGATHEALRLGRLAGATTILNPAPAAGLRAPTLELADILTPNRGELATLAGPRQARGGRQVAAGQRQARRSWSASAPTARCSSPAGARRPSAAPHVEAVDTVGAGDTLNGALAAGLAAGLALAEAARRAWWPPRLAVTRRAPARGCRPRPSWRPRCG